MYDTEYDPSKETVQEYVHRNLREAMTQEAYVWVQSVLYGDNSGGPLRGLLSENDENKKSY